jgi:hypothetical protein
MEQPSCRCTETIAAAMAGETPLYRLRPRLLLHLLRCPRCRRECRAYRRLFSRLRGLAGGSSLSGAPGQRR